MPPRFPLLIDTDPGVDDAIAILMALGCQRVSVLGLTTVGGNAHRARTTRNAMALLDYAGRGDVPVARGAARPTLGRYTYAYSFHGPGGLTVRLPHAEARPEPRGALELMRSTLEAGQSKTTLVALGPLTNVARLLTAAPEAARRIGRLVIMGGAVDVPGNVTAHAEFNFYNDPAAAQMVLASGMVTTLVDLGACRQAIISRDRVPRLLGGGRPARLVGRMLANWFRHHPERDGFDLCDPLTLAIALEPAMGDTLVAPVKVTTQQGEFWGQSRWDTTGTPVRLVRRVDTDRFFRLFYRLLQC